MDEAGLLVRMLSTAKGGAVAASNVLRALRQSRQAAALGLLEGHAQLSHGSVDIEVSCAAAQHFASCLKVLSLGLHFPASRCAQLSIMATLASI